MNLDRFKFPGAVFTEKAASYITLVAVLGFTILTIMVVVFPPTTLDRWFSSEVQEHGNAFFDTFMKGVSSIGYIEYMVPLVLASSIVLLLMKQKKEALFMLFTLVSGLVSSVAKYFVNRPRPAKDLVRVIELTRQQSYPSGHVLFYTVFFGFVVFLMYRLKKIPVLLKLLIATSSMTMIALVSISRVYLGAHWLTDVLAGYLLGIICLYGLIRLYFSDFRL
ncbi:phosphatase PAP2 family protein [Pedobacter fastidiosus]|uniref:Phosphatase PAP2 family protein n=1 Tax=Pedobacter fastidiosus TaxID=2765361 RepID=A0ABR7KWH2_9SPHI|nr:phosphatase PAP2 family protein [Pedobacter fastidiosus]MBC6112469.1 phosphatase PAP2 family protein [Pedobacter fastidiosus]